MTKTFKKKVNGNTYEITCTIDKNNRYYYSYKLIEERTHNYSMSEQLSDKQEIVMCLFEDMLDSKIS